VGPEALRRVLPEPGAVQLQRPLERRIAGLREMMYVAGEIGLAEISYREDCGLLAYSPLGFGVLSGKYLSNKKP